ncbi:MAG TPA: DUF2341 domain-containing protein, partial [Kofleriaceae bacterium]
MRWIAVLSIAGCSFAPSSSSATTDGGSADQPHDAAGPSFRKQITLAVNSPSELRDFPVSIVTHDPDLAQKAQADGSDIAFTALDGTPLAYELVAFDKASGNLEAWVRIPSVTASTQIELAYGGASIASSGTVWSPAIYAAAWHFAETSGSWMDSAGGHRVTPPSPASTAAIVPGITGSARQFDGVDDATQADPGETGLDFGMTSFSVQAWVDVAQSADAYDMVIDKGGDTNKPGYCFTLGTGSWYHAPRRGRGSSSIRRCRAVRLRSTSGASGLQERDSHLVTALSARTSAGIIASPPSRVSRSESGTVRRTSAASCTSSSAAVRPAIRGAAPARNVSRASSPRTRTCWRPSAAPTPLSRAMSSSVSASLGR